MSELWLRKVLSKTVFLSTDFPEKRVRVAKSKPELDELHDNSTQKYQVKMPQNYMFN